MNDNRTINELQYKVGSYSDLASAENRVFDGAKISLIFESYTDYYGFVPILTSY